jgi:hypothetical protein
MVHALNALRNRKSLILDTCEIFVKEPLLDWVLIINYIIFVMNRLKMPSRKGKLMMLRITTLTMELGHY